MNNRLSSRKWGRRIYISLGAFAGLALIIAVILWLMSLYYLNRDSQLTIRNNSIHDFTDVIVGIPESSLNPSYFNGKIPAGSVLSFQYHPSVEGSLVISGKLSGGTIQCNGPYETLGYFQPYVDSEVLIDAKGHVRITSIVGDIPRSRRYTYDCWPGES